MQRCRRYLTIDGAPLPVNREIATIGTSDMTVPLPPHIERIVNDAVLSGQYSSAEDVLAEAVTVWQSQQSVMLQSPCREKISLTGSGSESARTKDLSLMTGQIETVL